MGEPFKDGDASPPAPDVDALVRRVRTGVAGRLNRGEYSRADLEALWRIEHEPHQRADFGPAPSDDIARLHAASDPLGPFVFTSHRGGGIGRLVVAAKQWLRRLVRPVAAVTLAPQAQFNDAVARLLTGAVLGVQSLEADREAVARRLHDLELRNRELSARCEELQATVDALQSPPQGRARSETGVTG